MGLSIHWLFGIGVSLVLLLSFSGNDAPTPSTVTDVPDHIQKEAPNRSQVATTATPTREPTKIEETATTPSTEATTTATEDTDTQKNTETFYDVLSVVDGDTLNVSVGGKKESVRLIGIDTPETVHPNKPVECFGREASKKAKEMLGGTQVRLAFDDSQGERDKYGRLLAYVFLKDGTNFNEYMVEEGYAYEYTYNVPYTYQKEFKAAEVKARENGRGLWADGVCDGETEDVRVEPPKESGPALSNSLGDNCHPSYTPCLRADASDYDCAGGAGNGPYYTETVQVIGPDVFKLDGDHDGLGCE